MSTKIHTCKKLDQNRTGGIQGKKISLWVLSSSSCWILKQIRRHEVKAMNQS